MKQIARVFFPIFLALSILMAAVPVFAESPTESAEVSTSDKATLLHDMGLYAGTSTDKFNPDLGSALTRQQGIVMILRLMGLESASNNMSDADAETALKGYSDADKVSAWARKSVAYAVKNGLVNGFSDKSLQASGQITGNQYATLILKALGYSSESFSQATAAFAAKAGITSGTLQITGGALLTRGDAVGMSFGALGVPISGGTETIIKNLVTNGVVDKSIAEKTGLQVVEPAPPVITPYYPPASTSVTFSGVYKAPTPTFTMTHLQLNFSSDPTTLSVNDITVSGATKGKLSGTGNTRTLAISDITVADGGYITVSISSPSGYTISPLSNTVGVVHLPFFESGMPATYNTTLTVTAGKSLDDTVNYKWYSSIDATWDKDDTQLDAVMSYKPIEPDVGKYLIVRAVSNSGDHPVVSTVVTSAPVAKAAGSAISGTIMGTFPSATSIKLTGFAGDVTEIEANVAIAGNNYAPTYQVYSVTDGEVVITDLGVVTADTRVKVRMKETETTLAGTAQEVKVDKLSD